MRPFCGAARRHAYQHVHRDPPVQRLQRAVDRLQHVSAEVEVQVGAQVRRVDRVVDPVLVLLVQHSHSRRRVDVHRDVPAR